jgi:hypothetical protein
MLQAHCAIATDLVDRVLWQRAKLLGRLPLHYQCLIRTLLAPRGSVVVEDGVMPEHPEDVEDVQHEHHCDVPPLSKGG